MQLEQLPLSLAHRPALGRGDLLVAPSNEAAVAWIDRWPAWPAPALVVSGPAGSGKTHLAAVWRRRTGARLFAPETAPEPATPDQAWVVDDAPLALADPSAAERLLHLYNHTAARGGSMLLLARQPPAGWGIALADLRSRLLALPAAAIEPPDDSLLSGLLVKLFHDRQLLSSEEIVRFLLQRVERSCAAAIAAAEAIDRASLSAKRPITLPLVRRALSLTQAL